MNKAHTLGWQNGNGLCYSPHKTLPQNKQPVFQQVWKKCQCYSPQPATLNSWNLAVVRSVGSVDVASSSKAGPTGWAANPPVGRAGKQLQLEDEGTGCWVESPVLAGKVNSVDRGDLKPVAVAGLLQHDDTWKKERCIKNILACSFCYLCFIVFGFALFVMFIQWRFLLFAKSPIGMTELQFFPWNPIICLQYVHTSTTCHATPEPPLSNRKINFMAHWTYPLGIPSILVAFISLFYFCAESQSR